MDQVLSKNIEYIVERYFAGYKLEDILSDVEGDSKEELIKIKECYVRSK